MRTMTINWTEDLRETICARISEGQSIRTIGADRAMPSARAIHRYLAADETFWQQYARARIVRAESWADEIVEIADDASNDWMERERKDGSFETVVDQENIQRSRLRIQTRQWLMGKHASTQYGDKVEVDVSGEIDVTRLSDAELVSRTRAHLASIGVDVATGALLLGHAEVEPDADRRDDQGDDDAF